LHELHRHHIVHRDLKPRNVFNFSGKWKVGDFGISKDLERSDLERTFRGGHTLGYAAPEQLEGVIAHPSADIYSLGKIIAFLRTGQTDVDMIQGPKWRDLAQRCVSRSPQDRPTVEDVIRTLAGIPA
jgi:serine/threonine-protein kinase